MTFPAHARAVSVALLLSFAMAATAQSDTAPADPAVPAFVAADVKPPAGASYLTPDGAIRIGGAEHARYIVTRANTLYETTHSGARLIDVSAGADTAVPLLTFGRIAVGSMGRTVKPPEAAGFKSVVGNEPVEIHVAHAANDTTQHLGTSLAVYVHRDNPITQLTTTQVSQILSVGNAGGDFSRWGQVGLTNEWSKRLIHPLGTPEYSGFGVWMQANPLGNRPYAANYEEYATTEELLKRLENEPGGLTVAAIGRETPRIKQVAVSETPDGPFIKGTALEVQANRYPFGRYLYFYVRREADGSIDPVAKEYLKLLLSKEGQDIVASKDNGYIPLTTAEAAARTCKARLMKQVYGIFALLLSAAVAQAQAVKPTTPPETTPKSRVSNVVSDGRIVLHGSVEMAGVIDALNQKFSESHPDVNVAAVLKGSATALPALAAGATPIAFVVGDATRADLRAFRSINKHPASSIKAGYAGHGPRRGGRTPPAIYVHRSNPLQGLTMPQLAGLFTSGSSGGDINTWSQLGITGPWSERRVHLYGLRDDGEFATTLRQTHLGGMPFSGRYEPLPHDAAVVQAVASDPYGIGIVGWLDPGQAPDDARLVALAATAGKPFVLPGKADVAAGAYPLSPAITLYYDRTPNKPLEPFVRDYLALVLSDAGQAIIAGFADGEHGFQPLPADELRAERDRLKD